ncbi:MAG: hypothetical protein OQL19_02605, partial [Gammaproteobacteria bacterium]|nr:hypothetical protein [Gammaproteobacteria bacterium]
TYLSRWTWENYHYRELGLGYPCGSCEEISLKLGYWGFFPLFLQNELIERTFKEQATKTKSDPGSTSK